MLSLPIVWFILIVVLFAVFFLLEGFDFGVGMLLPFLGKNDIERRILLNAIGPFWDGNEVWLLTAGGAMFAAFPNWYATLFSALYLPLLLVLLGLILRGIGIEFRSKKATPRWRSNWDKIIAFGSFLPSLLFGVAFANMLRGIPINGQMQYVGGFFNLLHPYALLGGLTSLSLCLLQGMAFLALKTDGDIKERITSKLLIFRQVAFVLIIALFIFGQFIEKPSILGLSVQIAAVAVLIPGTIFAHKKLYGWFFVSSSLSIALFPTMFLVSLFPRVLVSSENPAFNLTIYNASSTPYTLQLMTIVAAIFVPIVICYQAWSYWIFRKRLTEKSKLTY